MEDSDGEVDELPLVNDYTKFRVMKQRALEIFSDKEAYGNIIVKNPYK